MTMRLTNLIFRYNIIILLLVLVVISAIISPYFFTWFNILKLLQTASYVAFVALGMLFVILTGEIDLSVGAIFAFSGVFLTTLTHGNWFTYMPEFLHPYVPTFEFTPVLPIQWIILLTLLVGVLFGMVNGVLVARFGVASFVGSLGVMTVARGLALTYTGGAPIYGQAKLVEYLGNGKFLGIPMPVWLVAITAIFLHVFLTKTRTGKAIIAVGSDFEASRLSGINVKKVKLLVFMLAGFLAAFGGILMCGRLVTADPRVANGWELDAIAAVVIGGARLSGGKGNVAGTIAGVLVLQLINNILNLTGVNVHFQPIIKGAIVIVAMVGSRILEDKLTEPMAVESSDIFK